MTSGFFPNSDIECLSQCLPVAAEIEARRFIVALRPSWLAKAGRKSKRGNALTQGLHNSRTNDIIGGSEIEDPP